MKAVRVKSKAKQLSEKYGGQWKYDGVTSWWCDDDKRCVSRTASCICDDYCKHPPTYYLHGDGRPKIVTWNDSINMFTRSK